MAASSAANSLRLKFGHYCVVLQFDEDYPAEDNRTHVPIPHLREVLMKKIALLLAIVLSLSSTAFAIPMTFSAILSGNNENPATGSAGTGSVVVVIDPTAHTLMVSASFSGLGSNTTASHIHCCQPPGVTAGVATQTPTFSGMPLGVTFGSFTQTLDTTLASSFNPAFITANGGSVTAAEGQLFSGISSGLAYFNIHTTVFGGGEIRGNLSPVPEPASIFLLAAGLVSIVSLRKRSAV